MENSSERVLAYTLSKGVTNEELAEVTGGLSSQVRWTTKTTMRATGNNNAWDSFVDVTVDL